MHSLAAAHPQCRPHRSPSRRAVPCGGRPVRSRGWFFVLTPRWGGGRADTDAAVGSVLLVLCMQSSGTKQAHGGTDRSIVLQTYCLSFSLSNVHLVSWDIAVALLGEPSFSLLSYIGSLGGMSWSWFIHLRNNLSLNVITVDNWWPG